MFVIKPKGSSGNDPLVTTAKWNMAMCVALFGALRLAHDYLNRPSL
jgi:hypothetical protein